MLEDLDPPSFEFGRGRGEQDPEEPPEPEPREPEPREPEIVVRRVEEGRRSRAGASG